MNILNALRVINQAVEDGVIEKYAVGGAIAAIHWAEPRQTSDLDIFIQVTTSNDIFDIGPIYSYFLSRGARPYKEYIIIGDCPVQILAAGSDRLEQEAIDNSQAIRIAAVETRVFTPEYLAALALQLYRAKDEVRIEELLKAEKIDLEKLEIIINDFSLNKNWASFQFRHRELFKNKNILGGKFSGGYLINPKPIDNGNKIIYHESKKIVPGSKEYWDKITESKDSYRKELSNLSFLEKLRILDDINKTNELFKNAEEID